MTKQQTRSKSKGGSRVNTRASKRKGVQVRGTTVSFTAPNDIADSGSGFTAAAGWANGQRVTVRGSADNDREFTIVTRADGLLTVEPQQVTTGDAGPAITVRQLP